MLSEKAAWQFLAIKFEEYAQGMEPGDYTRTGICNAIWSLRYRNRVSAHQRFSMQRQLEGIHYCLIFWFPRNRSGAEKRSMICTLLAEGMNTH